MDGQDKHKLEGLLQARAENITRRRVPRRRRPAVAATAEPAQPPRPEPELLPPPGTCADCAGEIDPRRVRAMPRATRCLSCQRAFEAGQTA